MPPERPRARRAATLARIAEHYLATRGAEIDETTAVTRWHGESMNYSTTIDWLLRRDGVTV